MVKRYVWKGVLEIERDCIFCKIANREMPTEIVLETEDVVAFRDINPAAPTHLLIIPKKHIPSLAHVGEADNKVLANIQIAAKDLAKQYGLSEGFRLVTNCGEQAGQTVGHLHFHLLGGRELTWPPG